MPTLVIAEKPSVARDLARVLGVKQKQKGFLQGNGWVISWCIGHLVELCEPHEYNGQWKRWNMDTLPMIPPQPFNLRPVKRTKEQYDIVSRLLKRRDFDAVVNACDAGREGELIFRYVYNLSGSTLPIQRLWISSMTDEAISEGFARLQPGIQYENLWHAARCRSEADWLVGMNATRGMTLKVRQSNKGRDTPLFSVGRVQTPTLTMLVQREQEIVNFKPEDYWQVYGHFQHEKGQYVGKWFRDKVDRFKKEEQANDLVSQLEGHPAHVSQVKKTTHRERPPLLFDLTRLQRTANKRYGYSAARTLEIAQELYEKHKLLTYPRTDSMHLSSDMKPKILGIVRNIDVDPYAPFSQELLDLPKIPYPKRIFNDTKVSDHHAIIPTSKRPNLDKLPNDARNIYDLVVRRFLGAFFPDAIIEKTKIITKILNDTFVTNGKVIASPGWRRVAGWDDNSAKKSKSKRKKGTDKDEEQSILPPVQKGDDCGVEKIEIRKKRTKPPPRYNEASLLAAMEGAGKQLDDAELQQALKDSGLGTPATRASIIETLLGRQYATRQGKNLNPTPKGMYLIQSMPFEGLSSPQLTGEWESRMARMARGNYAHEAFEQEVNEFVRHMLDCIKQSRLIDLPSEIKGPPPKGGGKGRSNRPSREPMGVCPSCKGAIIEYDKVFACRGEDGQQQGCGFRVFREVASKKLTTSMVKQLLDKGHTKMLKGFKSRAGNKFDAALILQEGGNVSFDFTGQQGSPKKAKKPQASKKDTQTPDKTTSKSTKKKQTTKASSTESKQRTDSEGKPTRPPARVAPAPPAVQYDTQGAPAPSANDSMELPDLSFASHYGDKPEAHYRRANDFRPPAQASPHALRAQVSQVIPQNAPQTSPPRPQRESLGKCPNCHTGNIIRGRKAWGCDRYREGCQTTIPFVLEGRPFQESEVQELIENKRLGPLKGFKDGDQTFEGNVMLDFTPEKTNVCLQAIIKTPKR